MQGAEAFQRHRDAVRRRLDASGLQRVGPDSVTWKVNREIVVVAGWGRAILLQLAHPLVAAGVAEHSTFRGAPLASMQRLWSTVRAMLSLTFGDEDRAITAAAGINLIHDRVHGRLASDAGPFAAGTPYSAHDAELLRWVHLTLLDSVPLTYELLVGPLTAAERDRYCEEAAVVEPLLDVPRGMLPRRAADVSSLMRETIATTLAVTSASRELARAVIYPPESRLLRSLLRPVRLITLALLPSSVRDSYGFAWTPRDEAAFRRWVSTLRTVRRWVPAWTREWRAARAVAWPAGRDPRLQLQKQRVDGSF